MELMFKFGMWKASIKSGKVPSAHLIKHKLFFLQCVNYMANELLMIHMQLTPVRSKIVLQYEVQ